MRSKANITFAASEEWHIRLSELTERLDLYRGGPKSRLLRDLVTQEYERWACVPYYSTHTKCLVYIDRTGTVVQWVCESLQLAQQRMLLPTFIDWKPEKKIEFEKAAESLEILRQKWIVNYFAAWRGRSVGESLISQDTDRWGTSTKMVDLLINQPTGISLVRESLMACRDYVQLERRQLPERGQLPDRGQLPMAADRVDFGIDIPVLDFELSILVDLGLYDDDLKRADATLGFELRNRQLARLQFSSLGPPERVILWRHGRFSAGHSKTMPADIKQPHAESIEAMRELEGRLDYVSQETTLGADSLPIVSNLSDRKILQNLTLPEEYIFGRLKWPLPYQSVIVSASWMKR